MIIVIDLNWGICIALHYDLFIEWYNVESSQVK